MSFVINCLRLHPFPPLHNCNRHMHHHCPHSLRMSFPMMMILKLLKLLWFSPAPLVVVTNLSSYFRINVLKITQMEILKVTRIFFPIGISSSG